MGSLISRFRKQSTVEVLREIQRDIDKIETCRQQVQCRRKRVLYRTVFWSVLACVISVAAVVLYCSAYGRISTLTLIAILLFLPLVLFVTRKALVFYYDTQLSRSKNTLVELLARKKSILQDVQENETYRVAKEILEKFAPELLLLHSPSRGASCSVNQPSTPPNSSGDLSGSSELRRRTPATAPVSPSSSTVQHSSALSVTAVSATVSPQHQSARATAFSPYDKLRLHRQVMISSHLSTSTSSPSLRQQLAHGPVLARPVLGRERSYLDRMLDMIVGDGPSNRYALICRACHSHNGMALKEEFEFLAFRCCYCHEWNPARKQRPTAPPLPPASDNESVSDSPGIQITELPAGADEALTSSSTADVMLAEVDETHATTNTVLDDQHHYPPSEAELTDPCATVDQHEHLASVDKESEESYEHIERPAVTQTCHNQPDADQTGTANE